MRKVPGSGCCGTDQSRSAADFPEISLRSVPTLPSLAKSRLQKRVRTSRLEPCTNVLLEKNAHAPRAASGLERVLSEVTRYGRQSKLPTSVDICTYYKHFVCSIFVPLFLQKCYLRRKSLIIRIATLTGLEPVFPSEVSTSRFELRPWSRIKAQAKHKQRFWY